MDLDSHLLKAPEDEEALEQQLYQSLVGSLMYLSVCTRPDLAYAVYTLARFSSKPNRSHWIAAKRVLRYLRGTANYGIAFTKSESGECLGYSCRLGWGPEIHIRLPIPDVWRASVMEK